MKRNFAITVKAVIIKKDKFLVLKRSLKELNSSYINKKEVWDLPGGGVKFCETSEQGLFRELREETGIKVSLDGILDVYDIIRSNIHMVIITYICVYIAGEVKLSGEHEDYCWVSVKDMYKKRLPVWMLEYFDYVNKKYNK